MKREGQTIKEEVWAAQAFEYYQALGPQRTFAAVAAKFKVKRVTVTAIAQKHDWNQKIVEYDAKLLNALTDEAKDEIAKMKDEIVAILHFMYRKIVEFNPDGSINKVNLAQVKDLSDLEKLTKLYLLVKGEATERVDARISDLRDIPEDALRAIAGNLPTESGMRTGQA